MAGPIVITGGGTGGHVFPMAAIADALIAEGLAASELRFVGSRRGQERDLLRGDVDLTLLPGRGVRRSIRARDLIANVEAVIGLAAALVISLLLVRRWRPTAVVSVGGYASFAVSFAAMFWRCPLVLVEFDATPGASQRPFVRYAARRCCAFPADGANVVVTGAPLRAAIESIDRSSSARRAARSALAEPISEDRQVVVAMTGSLGAHTVNVAVRELSALWASRRDRTLIHVTGRRDYELFKEPPPTNGLDYRVVAFGDMVELWGLCDVAICRAGAITVAELTALGIPSVLVPLPGAPSDHQTKNAMVVEQARGATLLRDEDCTGDTLGRVLDVMMQADTLDEMSANAAALGHRGAASAIARVVLDLGGRT